MSKVGISVSIDVTKIEKARLFKGAKGTYLDLTAFVDLDEQGQYGDNGMIVQSVTKEERQQGVKGPILGNVKVFYRDDQGGQQPPPQQGQYGAPQPQGAPQGQPASQGPGAPGGSDFDDEIPFLPMHPMMGG